MGIDTRDVRIEVHPPRQANQPTLGVITFDIGQDRRVVNNNVALYDTPQQVMADVVNESSSAREAYAAHEPRVNAARNAASATSVLQSSNEANQGSPGTSPTSNEQNPNQR